MQTATQNQQIASVPLLDVGRSNSPLKGEFLDAISSLIDAGSFIGGKACQSFENAIARFCQTEFAIGCASGSDALLLALMALDIGPGDEVICPSFTFFATASAIERLGATCVFADIDPATFNINARTIYPLISERTRAIIPVHLFGQCCEMAPIMHLAAEHDLVVIEDAAQAIGATCKGQPAGSIGHIGCFSFYPTKNLGGFGDGGMITTNNPETADRMRLLANHGMRPRYFHREIGINSRLDAMQAAILEIKLRHLPDWMASRAANAEYYRQLFQASGLADEIQIPESVESGSRHVWNQFTIRIPNGMRDAIRQRLNAAHVGTEIYYPIPLHRQECFAHYGYPPGSLPETERAAEEVLSLPIFPELSGDEIGHVVQIIAASLPSRVVN